MGKVDTLDHIIHVFVFLYLQLLIINLIIMDCIF